VKLLAELADDLAFGIAALRGRADRKKMMARLVEADRLAAVGTLAAGVAHEINTPLAYLLGGLDYVEHELARAARRADGGLDEVRVVLGEMRTGGERIRQIVRDLKTFSRDDAEARAPIDVRRVVESSVNMAGNEIRQRARVTTEYGPVAPVLANEARLGQVVLNLLINAAHAVEDGPAAEGVIGVRTCTNADGRVIIEVSDTGGGIDPENLQRIFEPFFTTKPLGVGTGLGLWISRNLVTSIGGELHVESTVGAGSVFRISLPPAAGETARVAAEPEAPRPTFRGRVLVVDDEALVGRAVRRALAEHDVVVETCARRALARLASDEPFGVILCDMMMPGMTGMELYAELAARRPRDAERVVFFTGGAFTPAARHFLDAVSNPRLEKPFDTNALRALVRQLLVTG
jgi:nitrogen-specific signal transduction histidine kinase/CheY-like chemotaxis protein